MENKINVLVFPCGAENGLEIHTALKDVVNITVYGASGKSDHGLYVYENYVSDVPYINDDAFYPFINSVIAKYSINIIIPTHDDVSLFLAENKDKIHAAVAVPGYEQARICRSKKETYDIFRNEGFCPTVYLDIAEITEFPVFVKPDKGQGGKNASLMHSLSDVEVIDLEHVVITEFLPGEELTIDCFSDRNGRLQFIGPRKRNRVFGGISVNSSTTPLTDEIKNIALCINEKIKMRGLWYFQLKQDKDGNYKLLEVSVRTAGTMNLYRGLGVNFPLLTVYDMMGYDVMVLSNDYELEVDRALFSRYRSTLQYDTIYLDFDDTVTRNEKVNPFVMLFIYNAKNNNKRIKLITRHALVLNDTFNNLGIHPSLFDEIIHLSIDEPKYLRIDKTDKAIFIDNAFKERYEVKKYLSIPVFDVDAISSLINWKE